MRAIANVEVTYEVRLRSDKRTAPALMVNGT